MVCKPRESSTANRIESPHCVFHYLKSSVMPSAIHEIVYCAVASVISYFKATDKCKVTDSAELLHIQIAQEGLAFVASELGRLMMSVFIRSEEV